MDHKVFEHQLKGGGKGLVIHVPGSPVTQIEIVFNSGLIFAHKDKFEVPHVMEHVMYAGSKANPDPLGFKMAYQQNGAYGNAHTNQYLNWYNMECSSDEQERITDLLLSQITAPLFAQESLDSDVRNVREELTRMTTEYARNNAIELLSRMFPMSTQGLSSRIEQLGSITREDILEHYRKYYTRANLTFFVAGSFEDGGKQVVRRIEKGIGAFPIGDKHVIPREEPYKLERPLLIAVPIKQIHYRAEYSFLSLTYRQRLAGDILSGLLTKGWGSWVMRLAREQGLAYYVVSSYSQSYQYDSFSIWYNVTPQNAKALFEVYAAQIVRAKSGDFGQDEVDRVAHMVRGELIRQYQNPSDFVSWYKSDYLQAGKVESFDGYLSDLMTITREEVVEVAKIVTAQPWSMALTGDITQEQADELYQTLEPIWQNS